MIRNWGQSLLGLSVAVTGACSMDTENVGSVTQAEILTCPATYSTTANSVIYDKEIVITNPLVVDDLCRTTWNSTDPTCTSSTKNKWHFWYLMPDGWYARRDQVYPALAGVLHLSARSG